MNLIIDIGNTVAKIAVFKDKDIVEILYDSNQTLECLSDICAKYAVEKAIVATVIDLNERVLAQLKSLPVSLLWLNEKTLLPVENLYETPETLGYDRMAAVVGAYEQFPGKDILVIDAGTCITYEFIDTAMREGVLKGMEYEISGYITVMKHKYPELLVFLTGGDDFSFDTNLKSIIFADRFLVLKGLNRILNYNNDRI